VIEPPIRVLVVSLVSAMWGAQHRLLETAPHLAGEGVQLVLAAPPGDFLDRWHAAGFARITLELPTHHGLHSEGGRLSQLAATTGDAVAVGRSAWRIARLARGYDLVQSHSLWAHLEVALAGRLARRPVALDLHDIVEPGMGRNVLGLAASLASVTIANSAATAATVTGRNRHVRVVHPGVDSARFHAGPADPAVRAMLSAHPERPLITIAGRVDPNKGVDVVVEAVGRLGDDGPCLAVVGREHIGSADYAAGLRARAAEVLGPRVRFIPPLDDVPAVLRASDVLVNASRHEPYGRTVLEAQACGTSVIGTDAGGIPELIDHGTTGLLVPPRDIDALADALRLLLGDESLRRRIVDAGLVQAASRTVAQQSKLAADAYHAALGR
jgi:glycosyltransferase involved in cell wall biosynthesis